MARKVTVFQTLKDKGNPIEVERDGPFICTWQNSWLGIGYYFWETFLGNAHWWGKTHNKNSYIICQAEYTFDDEKIFDLSGGNSQHLLDYESYVKVLKRNGFLKENKTTVSRVFHFMRNHIPGFSQYEAIRAFGVNSIGTFAHPEHIHRMPFESGLNAYLDLRPAIQICFFKKEALQLKDYRIIYPDAYVAEGMF